MYRDDLEAQRARVRTLEAELELEQRRREAAEAEVLAAQAARDEARLEAGLGVKGGRQARRRRQRLVAFQLALAAVIAAGVVLTVQLKLGGRDEADKASVSAAQRKQLYKLRHQVERLTKLNESQGLLLRQQALEQRRGAAAMTRGSPDAGALPDRGPDLPRRLGGNEAAAQVVFTRARAAYVKGQHLQARELARAALKMWPDQPRAWLILGASSCAMRDLSSARSAHARLGDRRQKLLRKLCQRQGISLE